VTSGLSLDRFIPAVRVEVDGQLATPEHFAIAAFDSYGHFTAMQVRGHQVRGLDLHFARLAAAHQEMFLTELDLDQVRSCIKHALAPGPADASVRVLIRQPESEPMIMVTVRPAGQMPAGPWRLQSVPYQRVLAHLKRLADFGQAYFQREVQRAGFDEALLAGPGDIICEGSITNIGFFDGSEITWPDAPVLAGITMQLLDQTMARSGLKARRGPVTLTDLGSYPAVFVCNARGIAPVGQIDSTRFDVDADLMERLQRSYESARWDLI
jgi:branched-subunit amino acid aminotransferase/4-amino-4-deoxychorismate lyase